MFKLIAFLSAACMAVTLGVASPAIQPKPSSPAPATSSPRPSEEAPTQSPEASECNLSRFACANTSKPCDTHKPLVSKAPKPSATPSPAQDACPDAPCATSTPCPSADCNTPLPTQAPTQTPAPSNPAQASAQMDSFAQEVVRLVNEERAKQGLSPVSVDEAAVRACHVRAEEIIQVFTHDRPNGSNCFTALQEAGASYKGAGENIAKGQQSPERVMAAWMSSPGHYANIMKASFTKIGVGHIERGGVHYWTQFFLS